MTRTLARRLATAGGALGIAVLACAGTASAATAAPAVPAKASVSVNYAAPVPNPPACPPHRGLLGDVVVDVVQIVGHLLRDLL